MFGQTGALTKGGGSHRPKTAGQQCNISDLWDALCHVCCDVWQVH